MRQPPPSAENFEQLVREHQRPVFRTLHRLTGPGPHLEDLAQEVFLRLYRALPEFRGDAMLSTYIYRITVNVAQDEWKRRRRDRAQFAAPSPALEDEDTGSWLENLPADNAGGQHQRSPEQCLDAEQTAAAVSQAMLELPEIERTVLTLYHGEDLSYQTIAATLHLPINTVRTHLHRGRKRLADLVQQRLSRPDRQKVYAGQRRLT